MVRCHPHLLERHGEVADDEQDEGADPDEDPAPDHRRERAAASRASVRSRPSTSSDSNNGGPTVRPVTATRTGACAFFKLRPSPSPAWVSASLRTSAFHSASVNATAAASSTSAAPSFIALAHDVSSSGGSSRNTKSTMVHTSD